MRGNRRRTAIVIVIVVGLLGLLGPVAAGPVAPASAALSPGAPAGTGDPDGALSIAGTDAGQPVRGGVAPTGVDPSGGYPASGYNTAGFVPADRGYAGMIRATGRTGGPALLYCVSLLTPTSLGLSYAAGSWTAAAVANTGYVARILNDFYPATGAPAAAATGSQKAAAVQAAIWFFTDAFVLDSTDPLYPVTSAIVSQVLAEGPVPEPATPAPAVTGPATGTAGQVTGPFTVTAAAPTVMVEATGGQLFADAAATQPLGNGASIPSGSEVFVEATDPVTVQIRTRATVTAPAGSAFLYAPADPDTPNPPTAQTLILAQPAVITATQTAAVIFAAAPRPSPSPSTADYGPGPALDPHTSAGPNPVSGSEARPLTGGRLAREIVLTAGIGGVLFVVGLLALRILHRRERTPA